MSDVIQLLPDSIANQIAAGEVVQRPASVVKELLENSVDAQSSYITLITRDAGKSLVQVIDNGKGMSETDARMCFERHATSKIRTSDDLFALHTYGFRGEAMASIAAVAQVELKSKQEQDELGTLLRIEASEVKEYHPDNISKGTSISVKNLFFNVPARRNFLKSTQVENRHIIDEFQRVAMANPHIGFSLYQNELEIYNLTAGKLSHRVVSLFGKGYQNQLIPCKEETDIVQIYGYVGKPEYSKRTRGEQFFFANNRFIKHNYLHHAVMEAYEGLLQEQSFPFYVLFIDIDPSRIDVNVHPTKTEIKFDDERTIYAIIRSAVKKALGSNNVSPSIDFDNNINLGVDTSGKMDYGKDVAPFTIPSKTNFSSPSSSGSGGMRADWQVLFEGFEKNPSTISQPTQQDPFIYETGTVKLESTANLLAGLDEDESTKQLVENTFQLHSSYIVTQVKSGMMLIDQQAAHERILYEKFKLNAESHTSTSQQFLFPQTLELNPADFALIMSLEEDIRALGIQFQVFGTSSIIINGVPGEVQQGTEKELFEGLIEQFKANKTKLKIDDKEALLRSLAKRSAIRQGKKLALAEMSTLIDQLFACETPNYAPNGNLTFVILDLGTILNYFK